MQSWSVEIAWLIANLSINYMLIMAGRNRCIKRIVL